MSALMKLPKTKFLLDDSKASKTPEKHVRKKLPQTSLTLQKLKNLQKISEPVKSMSFFNLKDSEKTVEYSLGGINIKITYPLKQLLDYLAIQKPSCLILRTQEDDQTVYRSLYVPSKLKPVHSELEIRDESVFVIHGSGSLDIDIASALYNPQTKVIEKTGHNLCKVTEKSQWKKPDLLDPPFLCASISLPNFSGKRESSVRKSKLKLFKLNKQTVKRAEAEYYIIPMNTQSLAPRPFVLKDGTGGYRIDQIKKNTKFTKDLPSFNHRCSIGSLLPSISSNIDLECSEIESRLTSNELKWIQKDFKAVRNKLRESNIHNVVESIYFLDSVLLSGIHGIEQKVDWENFCLFHVLFVLQKPTFFEVVQFVISFLEKHSLKHVKRSRFKRILTVISPIYNRLARDNALELRNTCKAFKNAGLTLLDMRFFASELAKIYQLNRDI